MRCGVVKIMPLGDSITEGFGDESNQGGYRGPLYQMLVNTGHAVDFVGSKSDGNIPDPNHEGHSGHTALELIHDPETGKGISEWLRDATPDVVLLHIGTNNIIRKKQNSSQITNEIAELLNEIDRYETAFNTVVPVILGRIINTGDPAIASSEITRLNQAIGSMALSRIAAGDHLSVVDFEHILSYPADYFSVTQPVVHPNGKGYRKMAPVWFDALNGLLRDRIKGWQGPTAFGGRHLQPGAFITPLFAQSETVSAALTVDGSGTMNVAWADQNKPSWQGPVAFGGHHLRPGGFITPLFTQSKTVFAALTVDGNGTMNVVWEDQNKQGWQGPVAFGGNHLHAGAFVTPLFRQSESISAALTVDKNGAMNVVWADQNKQGWQGPVAFGGNHLTPGAFITPLFQQSESIFAALTVDKNGTMNVAWADQNRQGWQGPVPFGGNHLTPGAFVTPLFRQSESIFAALTVDKAGAMNVVWADRNRQGWQGPVAFGGNHLQPGAFITPLFQQSESVFAALTVDRNGTMNVVWADQNKQGWQGPVAFGGKRLQPGAFITPLWSPSKTVFAALSADQGGAMNAVCADLSL